MRYVEARLDEYSREETYRIFVAESLRNAPQGKYFEKSFLEFLRPESVDNRTGDEIASDVMTKAGLHFGE